MSASSCRARGQTLPLMDGGHHESGDTPFSRRLRGWWLQHGRKDLPWQENPTPYRVWVSEIMLQQTQVATVVPYFQRFVNRFPDPAALAAAPLDEVLRLWTGLGYYARARHLHRAAQVIVADHGGRLPADLDALCALPGIGRSTAGAILSLAFGLPHPILDGNVKRVLCRFHGIESWPGSAATERHLWSLARQHLPRQGAGEYNQALMDLGAMICTRSRPQCRQCPLCGECAAHAQGRQGELPVPRPRRFLAKRDVWFLILRDRQGRVLLERRPAAGVWGGLWSFPALDSRQQAEDWLSAMAADVAVLRELPVLEHAFTHFRLRIRPWLVELQSPLVTGVKEGEQVWYKLGLAPPGGFAAPVVRLLGQLKNPPQRDHQE